MKYLHGYEKEEQKRLIHQARFLEPYVFSGIDLEFKKNCLEVGCGVGAQTKILCRRFPDLKIDSVDLSKAQLATAKKYLASEIKEKRVQLYEQNAQKLSLPKKYDSAFLCWFLEHVPEPLAVLKKVKKHLQKDAPIFISEVFNQTLFMEPYSPAYLKYWFEFNDYQLKIKGHPFIGADLGNLLKSAGFQNIQTEVRPFHFDSRNPGARQEFMDYFFRILLSAEETLIQEGRIDKYLIREMKREVEAAKKEPQSVFFYAFMRAQATA